MPRIIFTSSKSLGKGSVSKGKNHTVRLDDASFNEDDDFFPAASSKEPIFEGLTLDELLGNEFSKLDRVKERKGVLAIFNSLTEDEKRQMPDPQMIIRHFRAEKGDTALALRKLRETLQWRKTFGVNDLLAALPPGEFETTNEDLAETLLEENESGKIYVRGYDHDGRAFVYMRPANENTKNEMNQMKHLVWNIEKAVACTKAHSTTKTGTLREKFCLMIDYAGFKLKNAPPLSTTKMTLDILQNHYPERMYRAYFLNPPLYFRVFWKVAKAFVDPVTKEKIVFCNTAAGMEQLASDIENKHMLEPVAGGPEDARPFDSREYMHLPMDVTFGED